MLEIFVGVSLLLVALSFLSLSWTVSHLMDRLVPKPQVMPEGITVAEMPPGIRSLIDLESEPWAQQDLEMEASRLYTIHEDWDIVHSHLLKQVGEPSPKEASDRAWSKEPKAEDQEGNTIAEGF